MSFFTNYQFSHFQYHYTLLDKICKGAYTRLTMNYSKLRAKQKVSLAKARLQIAKKAHKMRKSGLSLREIGHFLGVSHQTIKTLLVDKLSVKGLDKVSRKE